MTDGYTNQFLSLPFLFNLLNTSNFPIHDIISDIVETCSNESAELTTTVHHLTIYSSPQLIVHHNSVGTNFGVGVEEARPEVPRAEMGFLGGDSQPIPTN